MKLIMVRAFLVVYSLLVMKSALPVVADLVAHTLWSQDHHSHHDHSHEHDHLSEELSKAAKNDAPLKKAEQERELAFVHIAVQNTYEIPFITGVLPEYTIFQRVIYSEPLLTNRTPPPRPFV